MGRTRRGDGESSAAQAQQRDATTGTVQQAAARLMQPRRSEVIVRGEAVYNAVADAQQASGGVWERVVRWQSCGSQHSQQE